ncbi:MAG: DUF4345 domain-containing protein [Actinomycetota bacterium]
MNKTILTIVIYVFGLFAVATALLAIIGGPGAEIGGKPAVASVDSQFRYVNVFWLAAGLILWWTARKPLERAMVTRTILVIAAIAGLARLISLVAVGLPAPFYWLTFVLEVIVTPLVVLWHSRTFPVARQVAAAK